MINLNPLKKKLLSAAVACTTLFSSTASFAHESADHNHIILTVQSIAHWLFAHQGVVLLVTAVLIGITVKTVQLKRTKLAAIQNQSGE